MESKSSMFHILKYVFDRFVGLIGTLFIYIPIYTVISIFYRFGKNKGPVLFKQKRLGIHGKEFTIYKFRSMIVDSEKILESNKVLYEKYVTNSYKLPLNEDPRLTKLGAFIRKTSIDEIPQFYNILKGDMSFIGPRPIVPPELEEYTKMEQKELLSMKPGAIGWWQVSGRSNINYPERCQVELYYIRHANLKFDIYILLKSLVKVVIGEGAH